MNYFLISSINSVTEAKIPMQEKIRLYQPWSEYVILKELYDLEDQKIFKADADKINRRNFYLRKFLAISKNTSIHQVLLIQLQRKNLVVTF